MTLWQQALLLLFSSLLIELVFGALLWMDLSSIVAVLKDKAHAVSTHVTLERMRDQLEALQIAMYNQNISRHAAPPGAMIQDQLFEELYHTGETAKVREVYSEDAKDVDKLLAENLNLVAQVRSSEVQQYVPALNAYIVDINKLGKERPDIKMRVGNAKFKVDLALKQLAGAHDLLLAGDRFRANYLGKNGLMSLRIAIRELRDVSRVERERQFLEASAGRRALNRAYVNTITTRLNSIFLSAFAISIASATFLVLLFRKTSRSRLLRLMNNMNRLTANQPLQSAMKGRDEFARLDATLAQMAGVISASRKKERAIVENTAETICSIDESGRFVVATPAAEKVLGFNEEELRNKTAADLLAASDKASWNEYFSKTKAIISSTVNESENPESATQPIEFWVGRKDGTLICTQWSLTWIDRERTGVCVIRDISERKRLEKSKQAFVEMVRIDLREPIAEMQEFLAATCAAKFGALSEDGRKQAKSAQRNNDRLLSLVDDLLNIENMSRGKMELAKGNCSSKQIIKQAFLAVGALASKSKIKLESDGEDDVLFVADSDRLVQVLVNLIGNAIKFSPRDSTIKCVVSISDPQIEFQVVDQGRGIPKHLVDSVFDRFKQVTKTDASEKGGAGLGLAICKSIIESHGGEIGARSEEGKGSTFWFRIPR